MRETPLRDGKGVDVLAYVPNTCVDSFQVLLCVYVVICEGVLCTRIGV